MKKVAIDLTELPVGSSKSKGLVRSIKIGSAVFVISGLNAQQSSNLSSHFEQASGDISTSNEVIEVATFQGLHQVLSSTLEIAPGELIIEYAERVIKLFGHGVYAEASLGSRLTGRLYVHHNADNLSQWGLENLLRVLTAYKGYFSGGFIVHSAGIVLNNSGYLFYGFSGAGKSTLSRQVLDEGGEILSDDLNLVTKQDNGWYLRRIPFTGELGSSQCKTGSAPLHGVFRLVKSHTTQLLSTSRSHAAASLLTCMPYLNNDPRRSDSALVQAYNLLKNINYGEIHWRKGPIIDWFRGTLQ